MAHKPFGPQDLKLKYYEMMIQYALNQSAYLDAAKYYYKVWETPSVKSDESSRGREVGISRLQIVPLLITFEGSRTYCILHRPRTPRQRTI